MASPVRCVIMRGGTSKAVFLKESDLPLDPTERNRELRRAYQRIVSDAPALWLYEVRNFAGVHKRIQMPPWRSDAWWLTLAEWTVDPAQKLPRDAAPE